MIRPKTDRVKYTLEFKQEDMRLVEAGLTLAAEARPLGMSDQTLFNWVKAHRQGKNHGGRQQACQCRADGNKPSACRTGTGQDGALTLRRSLAPGMPLK